MSGCEEKAEKKEKESDFRMEGKSKLGKYKVGRKQIQRREYAGEKYRGEREREGPSLGSDLDQDACVNLTCDVISDLQANRWSWWGCEKKLVVRDME